MRLLIAALFAAVPALGWAQLPYQKPEQYAIATAHPLATQAGAEILEAGGNAFDAAVAVTAALAVVEPAGSGLGGGGFYLLHLADSGQRIFVDAREMAPQAATADMYLDENGEVQKDWLRRHPLAAGIPGIPAALEHVSSKYGRLPLDESLAPAIHHAEQGFVIDLKLARYIARRAEALFKYDASAELFIHDSHPLRAGETLVQEDLAGTLKRIATFGAAGFYEGRTAKRLVSAVQDAGGIWTLDDLKNYRIVERVPMILNYGDWQITTAPPPSSGGLVMGLMFNILSAYPMLDLPVVDRVHYSVEAMRRAYFDRARFMGDSDFVDVPTAELLGQDYADQWRRSIQPKQASRSADFGWPPAETGDGRNTTHFSIMDTHGNRVAATLSINYPLGSGFVAEKTGVLLNNEMDDFVAKPGEANAYGLVGGQANAIEPGKRPLSSMSPTFVENGEKVAILGTPGGSRIITMVFQAIFGVMAGETAETIVSQPRFHHQYMPDEIIYEKEAFSHAQRMALIDRGHRMRPLERSYGNFQAVIWDNVNNRLQAATDPRGVGEALVRKSDVELAPLPNKPLKLTRPDKPAQHRPPQLKR